MIFKRKNANVDEFSEDAGQNSDTVSENAKTENVERVETPESADKADNAGKTVDTTTVEGLDEALKQEEKKEELSREETLERALQDEKERTLRLCAELENVRRRFTRELVEERKYSGMEVIRAILPVMDNLQRAITAAEQQGTEDNPLLEGVQMVYQQMTDALKQNNCIKIEAQDQPFDPNFHQAITQMPKEDVPENTVIIVAQDGYMLHDRVVRASQVVVSKKP